MERCVEFPPRSLILTLYLYLLPGGGGGDLTSTDLLTCGECKTKFPLQELVAYIQHKATNCTNLTNGPDMEDTTSHSQEHSKSLEKCVGSPSVTGSGQPDEDEEGRLVESQGEKLDAETNTTNTEPLVLTCSVCKQQLSSAWTLMQHIQVTVNLKHFNKGQFFFQAFSRVVYK